MKEGRVFHLRTSPAASPDEKRAQDSPHRVGSPCVPDGVLPIMRWHSPSVIGSAGATAGAIKGSGRMVWILGVGLVDDTIAGAVATMRSFLLHPGSRAVFFANAHTLNLVAADSGYRDVLNEADVVFGDGTGVLLAGLLRGVVRQANLVGTDVVPAFLRAMSFRGHRCYLLGLDRPSIERAARHAAKHFPGWDFVGRHHGFLERHESREVVREINDLGVDLLLVGMGNPAQERWIAAHRDALDGVLCAGVGGLLDYWAGNLRRAPNWIRRAGFEWLYIMHFQRAKVPRYVYGNPLFLNRVVRSLPADLYLRWGL